MKEKVGKEDEENKFIDHIYIYIYQGVFYSRSGEMNFLGDLAKVQV